MALYIGAAQCGDFGRFHAQRVHPSSGPHEPVVLNFPYGILVNKKGRRFIDEAPLTVDASYEAITREIMLQPEGIAYAICDSRLDDVPNWQKSVRTDKAPFEADSIEKLSESLNIDTRGLLRTVIEFNEACPVSNKFNGLELDDLATIDLDPPKSNWSRPIAHGPCRAWPIIAANCFTFGGLKIDSQARVLNVDGDVIPGLYSAGETAGLYYRTYTGATSVMRGAVFGRIAGRHAAKFWVG